MKALLIIGGLALAGGAAIAVWRARAAQPTDATAQRIREMGSASAQFFGGLIDFADTIDALEALGERTVSTNEAGGPATAVVNPKRVYLV